MLLFLSRVLRLTLLGFSIYVLSGIIPISLTHFHTSDACPTIGQVPACYIVSICYTAMGIASIFWNKPLNWLFFSGVAPVIFLALMGTSLEILGQPTCPQTASGLPLCYISLLLGMTMLLIYLGILKIEKTILSVDWNSRKNM